MKTTSIQDAIQHEYFRQGYARDKNYKLLKNTYSKSPVIPNLNTGGMWDEKNQQAITQNNNPMAWDRTCTIAKWTINLKAKNVLNIGFGPGNVENIVLKKQQSKNITWRGIDISEKSVERIKKIFPLHSFTLGNFLNYDLKAGSFDLVIASEVLEHVSPTDIFGFLKKVNSSLVKGGHFICSVPLNEGLEKMLLGNSNPNAHVRMYTPELILSELRIAGFKTLQIKQLYAFHEQYVFKTLLARILLRPTNNIIILTQKP